MVLRKDRSDRPIDFFISYSPLDEGWATWIAWELEWVGYRTVLQAWDFVPGTNFIDFMDRGVSEAGAVVAILSRSYLQSRYGRLEWQAALRADPEHPDTKLITIRIEECPLQGLLSMITFVDLVDVTDPAEARSRLLTRIRHAVDGRAKPARRPGYPNHPMAKTIHSPPAPASRRDQVHPNHGDVRPPAFPPATTTDWTPRSTVTILHLADISLDGPTVDGVPSASLDQLLNKIDEVLSLLNDSGAPSPDLVVSTGNLTQSATLRQFDDALEFLTELLRRLKLEADRLVLVPGERDINSSACAAYFANCEADEVEPSWPFWPKWRHYSRLFAEMYPGNDGPDFTEAHPWTLFTIPGLRTVLCGLNSTMSGTHLTTDPSSCLGEAQLTWFAERMRWFEQARWLRVGVVSKPPGEDVMAFESILAPALNLLVHGCASDRATIEMTSRGVAVVPPSGTGGLQLIAITADGLTRWTHSPGSLDRLDRAWTGVLGTFTRAESGDHSR